MGISMSPLDHISVEYNKLSRVLTLLRKERSIAVDTETNGVHPYNGSQMVGISFYFPEANEAHYLSYRHGVDNLAPEKLKPLVSVWNEHVVPNTEVVYFNALFDMHIMANDDMLPPTKVVEVMVLAKLLNENEHYSHGSPAGAYKLKRLAAKYLGAWAAEGESDLDNAVKAAFPDAKGSPQAHLWRLSGADVAYYASVDTVITYLLYEFYLPHIERWKLIDLMNQENQWVREYLFRMERNGVRIDRAQMNKLRAEELAKMQTIEDQFDAYLEAERRKYEHKKGATRRINLNSPAQIDNMLRDLYGIRLESTGVDYLNRALSDLGGAEAAQAGSLKAQVLKAIQDYRDAATPIKLYYDKYPAFLNEQNMMHPNYFIGGARTGRPTSSNPNLQQISKKGEFKSVFIPSSSDFYIVNVDLAQAELRVAAHYCQEQTMIDLMLNGKDMHQFTADALSERLGRPITRQLGKMANFGLLYRMSPRKAAIKFGIDLDLAEQIVYGWRDLYSNFQVGYYAALNYATQWRTPDGEPAQPFATGSYQYFRLPIDERVRHFDEAPRWRKWKEERNLVDVRKGQKYMAYGTEQVADQDMVLYPSDEHYKAFNFLIQGTIQGVMRRASLQLIREFDNAHVRPIFSVYDSLVFEVHKHWLDAFAERAYEVLYDDSFTVPLSADVEWGVNYKEMNPYERK